MTQNTETYFLDPVQYVKEESLRRTEREIDIATEIFIARKQAIHYRDIMSISNKNLASKNKLISWLNDNRRNKRFVRAGIITLYKTNHPNHFHAGKWEARNLALFIRYALACLADKTVVKNQNNVNIFLDSIQDETWFVQAVGLMATKLLEDLYYSDALKSEVAYSLLNCTITNRLLLDKIGRIVGRVGKNHEQDWSADFVKEIHQHFKQQIVTQLHITENHKEHKIFKYYEPDIKKSLRLARKQITSPNILMLT